MELMGQWAPSVQRDQSADKQGLGDKLGWFAFPVVTGGAGAATDGVGGGNGIAVGKNAPPEAIDFLKFFRQRANRTSSTRTASASRPSSARRARSRTRTSRQSSPVAAQPPSCSSTSTRRLGGDLAAAFNDATVALFLGKSTPEEVCQALTDAAATQ